MQGIVFQFDMMIDRRTRMSSNDSPQNPLPPSFYAQNRQQAQRFYNPTLGQNQQA